MSPRALRRRLPLIAPGMRLGRPYTRADLRRDGAAGVLLTALLVPAGMGYAEVAGLPPSAGLNATVVALVAYALVGPSRILVAGSDVEAMRCEVALGEVQIGPAHPADGHTDADLVRSRYRVGPIDQRERAFVDRTLLMHDPRPRETGSSPSLAHELIFGPGQRHATSSIIDP